MRFLYTFAIRLYSFGVSVAARFGNAKAKRWVEGRRQQVAIRDSVDGNDDPSQWIWFHAASLGEFEQGRPVMEALKRECPEYKLLLSFFSPSGYEVRKDYPLADEVLYLPADTPQNASRWVQRHHFVAAFFIKYEFWFNYMSALNQKDIPLFYISLILSPKSYFFKPYGTWFRKQLGNVSHFFVQDTATAQLLQGIHLDQVTLSGDTRFDRVAAIARQALPFPEVERFIGGRKCIIAGSTWPPDEYLLERFLPHLPDDYCLILAPHDISVTHVAQIKAMFPDALLYSTISSPCQDEAQPSAVKTMKTTENVLIINTIGILSQLYQYARFVYIGGGFGVNIHNIQEPITFGCPVVFGPKYESFKEAVDLVRLGGGFSVSGQEELDAAFSRLITDDAFFDKASAVCKDYLNAQLGATDVIMKTTLKWLSH